MSDKFRVTVLNMKGQEIDSFETREIINGGTILEWLSKPVFFTRDYLGGLHAFKSEIVGNIKTQEVGR
jgi:hypothetical protein